MAVTGYWRGIGRRTDNPRGVNNRATARKAIHDAKRAGIKLPPKPKREKDKPDG